jgi:hypothetical protein
LAPVPTEVAPAPVQPTPLTEVNPEPEVPSNSVTPPSGHPVAFPQAKSLGTDGPVGTSFDADGDGDLDVVVADFLKKITLYKNNGRGTFATTNLTDLPNKAHDIEAADVDGDGDQDFVVLYVGGNGDAISGSFAWYENKNGTFEHHVIVLPSNRGTNSFFFRLKDFTGDSIPDIITNIGNATKVVRNPWTSVAAARLENISLRSGVAYVSNLSDKPLADGSFVYGTFGASDNQLLRLQPTITGGATNAVVAPNANAEVTALGDPPLRVADIDNDGTADVITTLDTQQSGKQRKLVWWSGTTNERHEIEADLGEPTSLTGGFHLWFDTGDIDGDGDTDIATYVRSATGIGSTADTLLWLEHTGATWAAHPIDTSSKTGAKGNGVLLRQFNGDDRLDILLLGWPTRVYLQGPGL